MILTLSCVTNDPSDVFFICYFLLRVCVYVCVTVRRLAMFGNGGGRAGTSVLASYMKTCGEGRGAVSLSDDEEEQDQEEEEELWEDALGNEGTEEADGAERDDEIGNSEFLNEADFERLRRLERRVDEAYEFAVRSGDEEASGVDRTAQTKTDEATLVLQELYLLAATAEDTVEAAQDDYERVNDSIVGDSEAFLTSLRELLSSEAAAEQDLQQKFEAGVDAAMEVVKRRYQQTIESRLRRRLMRDAEREGNLDSIRERIVQDLSDSSRFEDDLKCIQASLEALLMSTSDAS